MFIDSFFIEVTFLSQMSTFSRMMNHHWKCWKQRKFSGNLGQNIFELYYVLVQVRVATSNRDLIYSITNLVFDFPHELPNNLRLRILGNYKILAFGKSQIWEDKYFIAQSCSQKLNFGDSSQKTWKRRHKNTQKGTARIGIAWK